jgi:hypothetical protein
MEAYKSGLDRIGILVASACFLHCIVLPVFLTTLPVWGVEVLENRYIEIATILLTLVAGGWAILRGFRKHHGNVSLLLLFSTGISSLAVASLVSSEVAERLLKTAGALLVVMAHVQNWRKCRKCTVCGK